MTKMSVFRDFFIEIYTLAHTLGLFCLIFNGEHVFVKFLLRHFKTYFIIIIIY